jgi:hypothetical protein
MSKKEIWVVCSDGSPQSTYVGKTDLSGADVVFSMNENLSILLRDALVIKTMHIPTPQGVAVSTQCVPIDFNRGPVDISIKPVWAYFPEDDEDGFKILKQHVDMALEASAAHKAKDAGIILPKGSMSS